GEYLRLELIEAVVDAVEDGDVLVDGRVEDQVEEVVGPAAGLALVAPQERAQLGNTGQRFIVVRQQQRVRQDGTELCGGGPRRQDDGTATTASLREALLQRIDDDEQVIGELLHLGQVRRTVRKA